jgi:hypothetical protein
MGRALRRVIRYFVLRPAALFGWLAGILALVAIVLLAPLLAPQIPGLSSLGSGLRTSSAPSATEDYLRGNRDYNADLVWSSLDADAQARLRDQGGSPEDLQRQMQSAKDHGIKLEEISYIGGKSLPDGTSMQFYLVGIRQQSKSDLDYQPYMFTLDRDGKIAKVQ